MNEHTKRGYILAAAFALLMVGIVAQAYSSVGGDMSRFAGAVTIRLIFAALGVGAGVAFEMSKHRRG